MADKLNVYRVYFKGYFEVEAIGPSTARVEACELAAKDPEILVDQIVEV